MAVPLPARDGSGLPEAPPCRSNRRWLTVREKNCQVPKIP